MAILNENIMITLYYLKLMNCNKLDTNSDNALVDEDPDLHTPPTRRRRRRRRRRIRQHSSPVLLVLMKRHVAACLSVRLTSEWPCYTNEKSSDAKSSLLAKCCGQSNSASLYYTCILNSRIVSSDTTNRVKLDPPENLMNLFMVWK